MKNKDNNKKEYFLHLEKQIDNKLWLTKPRNIDLFLDGKNLFLFFSKHRLFFFYKYIYTAHRGEKCCTFQCPNLFIYLHKRCYLDCHYLFAVPLVNFFSLAFHIKELQ